MRPPLVRLRAIVACLACLASVALVGSSAAASSRASATRQGGLETAILTRIDELRAGSGAGPLTLTPRLSKAAAAQAFSMAERGFFGHSSADGTSAIERILSYLGASADGSVPAGEIIAWTLSPATVDGVLARWLSSPVHENALLGRWKQVGIAAVRVPAAPGVYGGRDVTIVVVDFARRP